MSAKKVSIPTDVTILECSVCRVFSGNIKTNSHAWDGWSIIRPYVCPDCIQKAIDKNKKVPGNKAVTHRTSVMGKVMYSMDPPG